MLTVLFRELMKTICTSWRASIFCNITEAIYWALCVTSHNIRFLLIDSAVMTAAPLSWSCRYFSTVLVEEESKSLLTRLIKPHLASSDWSFSFSLRFVSRLQRIRVRWWVVLMNQTKHCILRDTKMWTYYEWTKFEPSQAIGICTFLEDLRYHKTFLEKISEFPFEQEWSDIMVEIKSQDLFVQVVWDPLFEWRWKRWDIFNCKNVNCLEFRIARYHVLQNSKTTTVPLVHSKSHSMRSERTNPARRRNAAPLHRTSHHYHQI
jgi:hypothetical protein